MLSPCCYRVTAVAIKLRDRSPVSTFVRQENGNGENATLSPLTPVTSFQNPGSQL